MVVAATHDLDLVASVSNTYDSYYFDVVVDATDIQFDYKLHPGNKFPRWQLRCWRYAMTACREWRAAWAHSLCQKAKRDKGSECLQGK